MGVPVPSDLTSESLSSASGEVKPSSVALIDCLRLEICLGACGTKYGVYVYASTGAAYGLRWRSFVLILFYSQGLD